MLELTDEKFDKLVLESQEIWLVEFYAPWCTLCKAIAPEFSAAAKFLHDKARFGSLDGTMYPSVAMRFDVEDFPTIKYFPTGIEEKDSPQEYDGAYTSEDIINWVNARLYEKLPNPEIVEIVNERSVIRTCEKAPLCVISFLPEIQECKAACRNEYLDIIRNVSVEFKKKGWGWLWTEAGFQDGIERALGIGGLFIYLFIHSFTNSFLTPCYAIAFKAQID